jgi:hypothetical protein
MQDGGGPANEGQRTSLATARDVLRGDFDQPGRLGLTALEGEHRQHGVRTEVGSDRLVHR